MSRAAPMPPCPLCGSPITAGAADGAQGIIFEQLGLAALAHRDCVANPPAFDEEAEYSLWRNTRDANADGYRRAGYQVQVEPDDGAQLLRKTDADPWRKLGDSWAVHRAKRLRLHVRAAAKAAAQAGE
jgi:hypothetical protein